MPSRIHGISTPLLILVAAALAIVVGAAVALALDSGGDEPSAQPTAAPTATSPAATTQPTEAPPTATASPQPATPVPPSPTAAVSETWSIDFQRSGGFAGLVQALRIAADGSATYEDMRAQRTETGTLDAATLTELRTLIDTSAFFSQPTPQEAPCADCFDLSITVSVDGRTHTVQAVDIALDPALQPLVDRLVTLLQDGLTQ